MVAEDVYFGSGTTVQCRLFNSTVEMLVLITDSRTVVICLPWSVCVVWL